MFVIFQFLGGLKAIVVKMVWENLKKGMQCGKGCLVFLSIKYCRWYDYFKIFLVCNYIAWEKAMYKNVWRKGMQNQIVLGLCEGEQIFKIYVIVVDGLL